MVYDEFTSKQHEILTGVVTRIDPRTGNASLRIGTGTEATDALLLAGEQVKGETLIEGQRIKVRANMGRSRIVERAGTLVHVHPSLFVVEVEERRGRTARQSYQYVDILTGTVELFDIDSGERLFDYVAEEQQ